MGNEIEKLQTILQEDPSNFQARRELSILLADNGFNEEALSNLQYLLNHYFDKYCRDKNEQKYPEDSY